MRLATFNLQNGRPRDGGRTTPEAIREAVASLGADVIGLQEVDRDQPRSDRMDVAAIAAEGLGADATFRYVATLSGTPGAEWSPVEDDPGAARVPEGPSYGVALASRLPVREWRAVRLPAVPVRSPVLVEHGVMLLKDEPRAAVAAVVETPAEPLSVVTTHLSFVPGWNVVQLRQLVAALADLPAPLVLLGDLNLPGPLARRTSGWTQLATAKTYPALRPRLQLDHVLARDPVRVTASEAHRLDISDHLALSVDLG